MVSVVSAEQETIELLKELIHIKSMSRHEEDLASFVGRWLQDAGMKVHKDKYGNLYGEYCFGSQGKGYTEDTKGAEDIKKAEGTKDTKDTKDPGPILLLNTHLDNVPAGMDWETDPFEASIKEGELYGRGACDPKGALAAMMMAIKRTIAEYESRDSAQQRMQQGIGQSIRPETNPGTDKGISYGTNSDINPRISQGESGGHGQMRGKLVFMGAVAEEVFPPSQKGTWQAVKDGSIKADMAICGEPTENTICIGEFGKMEYELTVHGKAAHAGNPEEGVNSILLMAELLTQLDHKVDRRWSELLRRCGTFNVGVVSGGTQSNIVPDLSRAVLERRLVPGQSATDSLEEMVEICETVKDRFPQLNYEIKVLGEGNAALISEEEPVVSLMKDSIEEVVGKRPEVKGFCAHADADWLITYGGIPTLIFGPGSLSDAHTCHEKVKTKEVSEATQILAEMIRKTFCR